jgi:hypothetical protein
MVFSTPTGDYTYNRGHQALENPPQYVKGEVHTNTVESAFSLLKRAVIGTYHHLLIKHLQRYLDEFGYRFNREDADIFEQTVSRMAGVAPMPYSKLIEENAFTSFVRPS